MTTIQEALRVMVAANRLCGYEPDEEERNQLANLLTIEDDAEYLKKLDEFLEGVKK